MAEKTHDHSKGLEYKNLIKEKILKPSKLPQHLSLKKHHSHLVIRDSNYFNKNPTSFIACASCHRGRVLKLSTIQESTTDDILNEIYSIIGVNPCSKKRAKTNITTDETKRQKSDQLHHLPSLSNGPLIKIPNFQDFFQDIDEPKNLSNFNLKIPIDSINSSTNITTTSLQSIYQGETNFPTSLDLFLSISIEKIFPFFYSKDFLIIPLPTLSNTRFNQTLDENIYLNDSNLNEAINYRINKYLDQENISTNNLKIIIINCSYQEGSPQNLQEDQSHKYVGKIIIISDFIVNELNNQLIYQTKKLFLNHDYTYIDSKFEWIQSTIWQKIIISPLQKIISKKFEYPILGNVISSDVFLNTSISINVPYLINSGFYQINHSTSLYIVCYLILNLLKKFKNSLGILDELNLMNNLNGIEYNNQFNIYILKLLLDNLQKIYA